ncbi:MAG TPA: haloacid dehalogenase-like hydrolase [Terriglobales bacterium]|nr:haloacid dehalogenase-like hydrolase [Terriglobales bacterium]
MSENSNLVQSVLALNPKLAVFDCDGTLWSGDSGEGFFDWELKRGVVPEDVVRWARKRYADYREGKVSEDDMCGEMVTLHAGLKEADVLKLAREFFEQYFVSQIFGQMKELVAQLQNNGCDLWAVSSTNQWVIREAMPFVGISPQKILAGSAEVKDGVITNKLTRMPSGPGKAKAILEVIGTLPDVAFGNSRWDKEMLTLARNAVAVNPNPDLAKLAREKTWTIYWPAGTKQN